MSCDARNFLHATFDTCHEFMLELLSIKTQEQSVFYNLQIS